MSRKDHLDLLEQIKEEKTNDQDEHVIHRMLLYMMDKEGFEPSREILSDILKERPDLADEIKIFKDIFKEIRKIMRDFEIFNQE
jgi:hypothetical protein